MAKSCKNCKNYEAHYCFLKKENVLDTLTATYCKDYIDKRNVNDSNKLVRCVDCSVINYYGWCKKKKRCFSGKEMTRERRCKFFKEEEN